jgi:3-oxoacyl-[acyl-carrier-protein] synthase II
MVGRTRLPDVGITGLGLVTPAGIGAKDNWRRVCSGVSCAATDPTLKGLPVDLTCRVTEFDADILLDPQDAWKLARFVQFAIVAARQALEDAGWHPGTWDGARVGVVLGNSLGDMSTLERQHAILMDSGPRKVSPLLIPMSMVNMVAGYVAIDVGAQGPSLVTATACASGSSAIGVARDLLRAGTCDVVLAGGTESALSPLALTGLARMGALSRGTAGPQSASRPFDTERDGFVAGEGAGVLVMERVEDAKARNAQVRAVVRGYGSASDAHHPTQPEPTGRGVTDALRAALTDAGLGTTDVEHVNAHATSTPIGDVTEGLALQRVLGTRAPVTSTKGVTGHTLAAAGAIEAAFTVLAMENAMVPPTANLCEIDKRLDIDVVSGAPRPATIDVAVNMSLGFGGHNSVLVLTST